ncbi:MAG: rhodanese-like domain-containing protein [Tepidisphaeraceae bacterium]|jgi:rhodanese-related sulfurtransferase
MSTNTIPLAECRRLIDSGQPIHILDVRTPAEFARVHALGARLMPLDELDPAAVAAQRRDADDPIYVICQSGGRAAKACQRLQEAGLAHVYFIQGGTAAWERMGLPVERGGGNVISLERQVRIGAGSLVLLGLALAWRIHWGFLAIPAFVGGGLVFAGITDYCGMALVLGKMPWNRRSRADAPKCSIAP